MKRIKVKKYHIIIILIIHVMKMKTFLLNTEEEADVVSIYSINETKNISIKIDDNFIYK